jgi:single-stranded DNA-binding protein
VSVAGFGKAAETAAELRKGDRCYVEGAIKLESWRGQDGAERHGLSVAAFKCERTHQIGRNRPRKRERDSSDRPTHSNDARPFNDEIPFAPELRG